MIEGYCRLLKTSYTQGNTPEQANRIEINYATPGNGLAPRAAPGPPAPTPHWGDIARRTPCDLVRVVFRLVGRYVGGYTTSLVLWIVSLVVMFVGADWPVVLLTILAIVESTTNLRNENRFVQEMQVSGAEDHDR